MDEREENRLPAEERRRQRMLRRKKELRIARIKFGAGCGLILLLIILLIVACSKGCKRDPAVETTPVTTTPQIVAPVTEPAPTFAYQADAWSLILVDASHPLPQDYSVDLTLLGSGAQVDSQCYPDLQEMFDVCRASGYQPSVYSAYLTETDQQKVYETKVNELMATGYKQDQAETEALKYVSKPGCSEYQTGLALDIVKVGLTTKDTEALSSCDELNWMRENAWKYGFVERYTQEQAQQKGVSYQPWHYRYVGRTAAQDMHDMNLCLEDLINLLP